jgi:hypothetical protein
VAAFPLVPGRPGRYVVIVSMPLTTTCRSCGSRTAELPHVCRNQLCPRYGHRLGSDFTPSTFRADYVALLPLSQFAVRHWFQLIALLALTLASFQILGSAMMFGAPLLVCAFAYIKWRGFVFAFVDAIFALYAIIIITVIFAFVL